MTGDLLYLLFKYWPIALGTVLYLVQGCIFIASGQYGMAGMFAGYSVANIAIIVAGEGI